MNDPKRSIYFYMRDDGIPVIEFHRLDRKTTDLYVKIIESGQPYKPPVRILYKVEITAAPPPYFLGRVKKLFRDVVIPHDTRNAYLLQNDVYGWAEVLRWTSPLNQAGVGEFRIFRDEDKAIAWLKVGWPPTDPKVPSD